jgi:NTE family protein
MGIRARSGGKVKTFALALGGGGARGLAQIAIIEALDELGVKPVAIAGVSVGAAIGAAYAAGMRGKAMRRHVIDIAHNRPETFARLYAARAVGLTELFGAGFGNPMVLDAERLSAAFLPAAIPARFEDLAIPLSISATDLSARSEVVFTAGPLKLPIAASLAVPGLLQPVVIADRILVDGAALNPLPFDRLRGCADMIVAIDSSVGPTEARGVPGPWEALFATIQVVAHAMVTQKLKDGAPDLLIRPNVGIFRVLDFLRASAILRAAEPVKAEVKDRLGALLDLNAAHEKSP